MDTYKLIGFVIFLDIILLLALGTWQPNTGWDDYYARDAAAMAQDLSDDEESRLQGSNFFQPQNSATETGDAGGSSMANLVNSFWTVATNMFNGLRTLKEMFGQPFTGIQGVISWAILTFISIIHIFLIMRVVAVIRGKDVQ